MVHVLVALALEVDEEDRERLLRVGEKAVLRRRREALELRRGVKDWKRLVREEIGEGMMAVWVVGW